MRIKQLVSAAALAATVFTAAPAAAAPVAAAPDADGKALILVPLTLTKIDDLEFGTAVPSSMSGTITINATTGARTLTGGVTGVMSDAGHRAYFAGAGSPNQQVFVAVNAPAELTSALGDTIPVLGMTLDGSAVRSVDPVSRAFFVGVGGTIEVAADQPDGDYNADFSLTAIYQ